MKVKAVFFDCDGTLIFGSPWVRLNRKMGISDKLDRKWIDDFVAGKLTSEQWTKNIEEYYIRNKLDRKKFEEILDLSQFVFNQEAYELISYLQENNIQIGVISSGIDYYVAKTAEHFGIRYVRDNAKFIFDDNNMFVKIQSGIDDLDQKVKDIDDICKEIGCLPQEAVFIGDANNDTKAFEYTKRGIFYKTKNKADVPDMWTESDISFLKSIWKKVDSLGEIIDIINEENGKKD